MCHDHLRCYFTWTSFIYRAVSTSRLYRIRTVSSHALNSFYFSSSSLPSFNIPPINIATWLLGKAFTFSLSEIGLEILHIFLWQRTATHNWVHGNLGCLTMALLKKPPLSLSDFYLKWIFILSNRAPLSWSNK